MVRRNVGYKNRSIRDVTRHTFRHNCVTAPRLSQCLDDIPHDLHAMTIFTQLRQRAGHWLQSASHFAVPDQCRLCGIIASAPVCELCQDDVLRPVSRCLQCALPLITDAPRCGACLRDQPPYECTLTLGDYAPPQASLVTALKYRAHIPLARWLAHRLAERVRNTLTEDARPTLLLPVPLAPRRLRQRGFNQAWEITRHLAKHLDCLADPMLLQRVRETAPQPNLTLPARRANVRRAFVVREPSVVRGAHVGVVDDVMTSGATLHAVARLLKRHGAARVTLLVALRTPR